MLPFAFFSYTAIMSITPGPNNLMLAASGVNHGFRRTIPHVLGISVGVMLQLFLVAFLLGSVLQWFELARKGLAAVGCVYLLWLSWRLAQTGRPERKSESRPLGFGGAVVFQALNPKAWMMSINSAILFIPKDLPLFYGVALMSFAFALINLPCVGLWALSGDRLSRFLESPRALRAFNGTMAGLLALTAFWLLIDEFAGPSLHV